MRCASSPTSEVPLHDDGGDHGGDLLSELLDRVETSGGLAALIKGPGAGAIEQRGGDGALDHVRGDHDEVDALLGEHGDPLGERILAGALGQRHLLVLGHGLDLADEVRLVAGHEHHATALGQRLGRGLQSADLGVAVQAHGVVLAEVRLHAARGVEDHDVDGPEAVLRGLQQRADALVVGEVGAHGHGLAAGLLDLLYDLIGARSLLPVVHDDVRALSGEDLGGVGADAARGSGDDDSLACH